MGKPAVEKHVTRVLRVLKNGPALMEVGSDCRQILLSNSAVGTVAVPAGICREIVSAGLAIRHGQKLTIEPAGMSRLARLDARSHPFAQQHCELEYRSVSLENGQELATVNPGESPLGRLARLKSADGGSFLSPSEFQAGDRLRADFARGQMEPRLGIDWTMTAGAGFTVGCRGAAELNDAAIAARRRVTAAIEAVGPELSGILVDVCCFLKGLSEVERERSWPVRSAKVVLKTALAALSRHYEPGSPEKRRTITHWGAAGYRPSMRGLM